MEITDMLKVSLDQLIIWRRVGLEEARGQIFFRVSGLLGFR